MNSCNGQNLIVTFRYLTNIATVPFPFYTSLVDKTETYMYFMSNDGSSYNIILNQISTSGK